MTISARARLTPFLALAALTVIGCSASYQGASRENLPTTLPAAPEQVLPASAQQGVTEQTPIAELADSAWLDTTAEATDIPRRVLAAYAGASLRVAQTYPECRLGWNTIAGIGAVETLHGTYGGASTDHDGNVTPKIFGPSLDGSPGVMAIEDSDRGELDDDTEWDRAVGPLQFIPSTWDYIGQDGNADGTRDPHHIDDAALTTAVYLCQGQRDTSTDEGWQRGVLAYNRSVAYANQVAQHAETYGQAAPTAETTSAGNTGADATTGAASPSS
ncbi:lytic transglycosylase domain-containing protein [Rothia nasimurium]|uniref:lytic transglycosylase domain-containing protein n=1 Tax=Rothia nasimurium TaxID=85336 RepID=UPI0036245832